MDSCSDEQKDEIEAIQSIFMDDIIILSENPFKLELTVHSISEASNSVSITLLISLPPAYPQTSPDVTIKPDQTFTSKQRLDLLDQIHNLIKDSPDIPVIYLISEKTIEWLTSFTSHPKDEYSYFINRKFRNRSDNEAETKSLFIVENLLESHTIGNPVTPDSYATWQKQFMLGRQNEKEKKTKKTGKEIFEELKNEFDGSNKLQESDIFFVDKDVFQEDYMN